MDSLRKQLKEWESALLQPKPGSVTKWNEDTIKQHLTTYKDQFDELVRIAKEKKSVLSLNKENV